ncbi:hypothetical protein BD779DRAFT_1670590 [Infundibulicybe gibba]|nr:hypothetical protein BD779DRAFT_1670590 [Infundibulicybe gibba]
MTFLLRNSATLLFLTTVILYVFATPVHETNSDRMARGLPPSPPVFGRTLPGMSARNPSPALAAKRSSPSSLPSTTYTGRLLIRNGEGNTQGYVRNSESSWTIGGLNSLGGSQFEAHVSFTTTSTGTGPFDILVTNPLFPAPFFVGAAGQSIGVGSFGRLSFTNVEQTPPGSTPVNSPVKGTTVESAIWSFDPNTQELKPQWINPDSSKPKTTLAYNIRTNELFFTGDLDLWNKDNDTPSSPVQIFLAPL